jgi:uncharacterized protein with FMN-binding domain
MNTISHWMTRQVTSIPAALCAVLLASAVFSSCVTNKKPEVVIGSPDLGSIADGKWYGAYGDGPINVEVEVAVTAHRIDSVKIVKHRTLKGRPAERIVDSVVAAQSLQVDVVSGATGSSKCILKAIEAALESGARG